MAKTGVSGGAERPIAYSYVRFSTAKQMLGDSLQRQVEACEAYCREKELDLHPVSYRDLGVSAFKRDNLEKGALAAFISAVKTGKIAKGSYLIIEQFDRLSRDETDTALELLLHLVKRCEIIVVTLVDKKVWDREAIKDTGNLVLAIVFMSRAHNESATKSERLKSAWGKKKLRAADGPSTSRRIVTSECPRWLKPNPEKTGFLVLEDKVESVRKVFDMRINGFGIIAIVSRANTERWSVPGKRPIRKSGEDPESFAARSDQEMTWHASNVSRLLKNRALLGEYLPHVNDPDSPNKRKVAGDPIPNYYPPVLDETVFLRAQAKAERSGRFPGRRDASLKNWLQGLLRCTCGQSFVRKNKNSLAQPEYARYYCSARNRGVTKCPGANAQQLETAILTVVSTAAPQYFQGTAKVTALKTQLDMLELEVSSTRHKRDRFVEAIASSDTPVAAVMKKVAESEHELQEKERQLASVKAQISDLTGDYSNVFDNILKAVKGVDSLDARAALREELSRVIDKAVVHQAEGFLEVFLRGETRPILQPLDVDAFAAEEFANMKPDSVDSSEPFQPDPGRE